MLQKTLYQGEQDVNYLTDPVISAIKIIEGERAGAIIRISDITETKLVQRQLIQSEKLASLGLLTSGIAHEVNMAGLTGTLFVSEFFGHTKGAFTGAEQDRKVYLETTNRGTLFLDKIGHLPLELQ